MKQFLLCAIVAFIAAATVCACSGEKSSPEKSAVAFVEALKHGDYQRATQLTLHLDSAPDDYRHLMAARYIEMSKEARKLNGELHSVACTKTITTVPGKEAEVFLCLTFANKAKTTIALQLVKHGDQWLIK